MMMIVWCSFNQKKKKKRKSSPIQLECNELWRICRRWNVFEEVGTFKEEIMNHWLGKDRRIRSDLKEEEEKVTIYEEGSLKGLTRNSTKQGSFPGIQSLLMTLLWNFTLCKLGQRCNQQSSLVSML